MLTEDADFEGPRQNRQAEAGSLLLPLTVRSEDIDARTVLEELLEQSHDKLEDHVSQIGVRFCTIDLEHEDLVQDIDDVWLGIALIGCTIDGKFSSPLGFPVDSAGRWYVCRMGHVE